MIFNSATSESTRFIFERKLRRKETNIKNNIITEQYTGSHKFICQYRNSKCTASEAMAAIHKGAPLLTTTMNPYIIIYDNSNILRVMMTEHFILTLIIQNYPL